MPRNKIAQAPDNDDEPQDSATQAREHMLQVLGITNADHKEWVQEMHIEKAHEGVKDKLRKVDTDAKKERQQKIERRKMKKFNSQLCLRLVYHSADGEVHAQMPVEDSIYLNKLMPAVARRLGLGKKKVALLWCTPSGETVPLTSQVEFTSFAEQEWCTLPWVLHVFEANKGKPAPVVSLEEMAKTLFNKYDVDGSGSIDRSELMRMLKSVDLSKLEVSVKLLERFCDGEFAKIDADNDGGVSLQEFTKHVTHMCGWMRDELMLEANRRYVFAILAARSVEVRMAPMAVPAVKAGAAASEIRTPRLDVRVLVPPDALADATKAAHGEHPCIAIVTLAPERVIHLSEKDERRRGEFSFSPVVQIDYPAAASPGDAPPAADFAQPLTLLLPHCFSDNTEEGMESLVMLGARHGGDRWEYLPKVDIERLDDPPIMMERDGPGDDAARVLRVRVPFAGTFCAFSNPDVEDVARVRFHVFALPEVPRDAPTTIRIHLCPELPDQCEEMRLADSSEWGMSAAVGVSGVLSLYQGACFELRFQEQTRVLKWYGSRTQTAFTYTPSGAAGGAAGATLASAISVDILPGEGRRASRVAAVAKRAGIPSKDWQLTFVLTPRAPIRPPPPRDLELSQRTPWDVVINWRPPAVGNDDAEPPKVTLYSLELSVPGASGTYGPFAQIWQGDGLVHPDFTPDGFEKASTAEWLQAVHEKEQAACEAAQAAEAANDDAAADGAGMETISADEAPAAAPSAAAKGAAEGIDAPPFQYILDVAPELQGRLRMRCWCEGELRPSAYSAEAKLTKWLAKIETKDQARLELERRRRAWLAEQSLPPRSENAWTADCATGVGELSMLSQPGTTGTTVREVPPPEKQPLELPCPYELPQPSGVDGLAVAGARLARLYLEIGVPDGPKGLLFGLHIDHVLLAICAGRVGASVREPLMALLELAYADTMLPMLDTVVVAGHEWAFVLEKLSGVVTQVLTFRASYAAVEAQVGALLLVLLELYETMRQCEFEMLLALHCTDAEYPKHVKRALKGELVDKICATLWQLSTELLKLQISERGSAVEHGTAHTTDAIMRLQVISHLTTGARKKRAARWAFWKVGGL